jgi:hypothetical protein
MRLPSSPGVYVIELLNEEPISVNADRPLIADRCIRVTRENCKYGQAKNLARRQLDYEKTFGLQNVRFRYFAITEQFASVETEVGRRLLQYRIRGSRGRLNEWLQGISAEVVEAVVREVLTALPVTYTSRSLKEQTEKMPTRGRDEPTCVTSTALVEAATYLQAHGMAVDLLRNLHHSPNRNETFTSTLRYFSARSELKLSNVAYGARLIHVAQQHQATGAPFDLIAAEALKLYPL